MAISSVKSVSEEARELIAQRKKEILEKVKNGETETSIAVGGSSFTETEWDKLINRIDEIIVFEELSHESILSISKKMLSEVAERIRALGVTADFDESVARMLAACEDVKQYGARPLRREIFSKIEDSFSLWMLDGKLVPGDCVTISVKNGEISFEKKQESFLKS